MARGGTASRLSSDQKPPGKCQCIFRAAGDELPAISESLQRKEPGPCALQCQFMAWL